MKRFLTLLISGAIVASAALAQSAVTPNRHIPNHKVNSLQKAKPDAKQVHKKKAAKGAAKHALNPGEKKELYNVPFNFTEGTPENPVEITLDENGYIPASLIGEKNYGFGGDFLYQAGGSLFLGKKYYDMTGGLNTPIVNEAAGYTITFEARSTHEEGDNIIVYPIYHGYGTLYPINDQWKTYSFTFDVTALEEGEEECFRIYGTAEGIYIRNLTITAFMPTVDAPVALPHSNYTGESFTANWEAVPGATKYLLTVDECDAHDNFVKILMEDQVVNGTSYVVNGIELGKVYYYSVKAADDKGESFASEWIEVADLPSVENVVAVAKDDYSGVDVSWNAVPVANWYGVSIYNTHTAEADETFMLADADFSSIESSGTWDEPEVVNYSYITLPQMLGWRFYLPVTVPGAVGVQQNWDTFYTADIELFETDFEDGEVEVTMELASTTGAGFNLYSYVWDEEEKDWYWPYDEYYTEPLTKEFKTFTYTIDNLGKKSGIVLAPYNAESYDLQNIFVKSFKAAIKLKEGSSLTRKLTYGECEESPIELEIPLESGLEYFASVLPYAVDEEEGYWLYDGHESDLVPVTMPSAVRTLGTDSAEPAEYYNLQGIRVANPEHGIYIVKKGNTTTKHVVR